MCKLLEVSRSGFYAWLDREESDRAQENRLLLKEIRQIHKESRGTYGSPRVHAELVRRKRDVGINRVARLMAKNRIRSKVRRRYRVKTTDSGHDMPVAENLLEGRAPTTAPDQVWVADITYVPTAEGWLYLASIMDLHSRRVVGWSMKDTLRVELTLEAMDMALKARTPTDELIHHSDRGSQYTAKDYQRLLEKHGIEPSMSGKGNCYDNAAKESFFHSLKVELVHHESYRTRAEARASVFEWIEAFYNRQRLHSALGYRSPAEFEAELLVVGGQSRVA